MCEVFLKFRLGITEKLGIMNLSSYTSFASVVLCDSGVEERAGRSFYQFLYCILFIHGVAWPKNYIIKCAFLPYFRRYFVKTWSFHLFIHLCIFFLIYLQRSKTLPTSSSVGYGYRIHRLHLWKEVRTTPNECSGYHIKQSDGEAVVMLELWWMQSTPSLPSHPGPLWPGVLAPERVLWVKKNCLTFKLSEIKWFKLNWIASNRTVYHLTACKQMTDI